MTVPSGPPGGDEGGEDERAAIDRAFADLVAGYHLTADRPEPSEPRPLEVGPLEPARWAPPIGPPPGVEPDVEEHYVPDPAPPLPKPAWPVLVAWLGMGYAVLVVLAVVIGMRLPDWAAWLGVIGFVLGFAILIARLPRSRPPDAGDGAVV